MRKSKYSQEFKEQFLRQAYRPGSRGPYGLASEQGISKGTVYRWILETTKLGAMPDKPQRPEDRSPLEKLRLVIEASRLDDAQLGEFFRREGIHEPDLERWRNEALGGLAGSGKPTSQPPSKRLRELERELKRKDKALAEAAALLVLSKKARALWGEEDDDMSQE